MTVVVGAGWAAKLTVMLGEEIYHDFLQGPGVLFNEGGAEIQLVERLTVPTEESKGWARVRVTARCFPSSEEASNAGYRIAQALLAFSVSHRVSLSFEECSPGEIVEVVNVDTQRMPTIEGRAMCRSVWPLDAAKFTELLAEQWRLASQRLTDSDQASLRFYAAAEMEISIEARFILLMTALEAFCVQTEHPVEVKNALANASDHLAAILGPGHPLQASLVGQVKSLKRESVAQAIKRTLEPLISTDQLRFVVKAYGFRSKLLHEGQSVPQISQVASCLKDVLRLIYSNRFGWSLRFPATPNLPF